MQDSSHTNPRYDHFARLSSWCKQSTPGNRPSSIEIIDALKPYMEPEHRLPMIYDAANLLLQGTDKSTMAYQRTAQLCGRLCVPGKFQYDVVVPTLRSMQSRGWMLATTALSLSPATTQQTGQVPTVADLQNLGLDRTQALRIQGLSGKGVHVHLVLKEDEAEDNDDDEEEEDGESDDENDNSDDVDSNDNENDDEDDDDDDDSEDDDVQRPNNVRDRAQAARNPPIRRPLVPGGTRGAPQRPPTGPIQPGGSHRVIMETGTRRPATAMDPRTGQMANTPISIQMPNRPVTAMDPRTGQRTNTPMTNPMPYRLVTAIDPRTGQMVNRPMATPTPHRPLELPHRTSRQGQPQPRPAHSAACQQPTQSARLQQGRTGAHGQN